MYVRILKCLVCILKISRFPVHKFDTLVLVMQLITLWAEAVAVPVMLHGEKSPAFIHTKPHHSTSHRKENKALVVWIIFVFFKALFSGTVIGS